MSAYLLTDLIILLLFDLLLSVTKTQRQSDRLKVANLIGYKITYMDKDSQIMQIINDQPKICIIVLEKKIIVLYTIVSIGVGGHFSCYSILLKNGPERPRFSG